MADENWKREILVREQLTAATLISSLANLLYADKPNAVDREAAFFEEGGPFAQLIADAAAAKADKCKALLNG